MAVGMSLISSIGLRSFHSISLRHFQVSINPPKESSHTLRNFFLVKYQHNCQAMEASTQCSTEAGTQLELSKEKCVPCESKDLAPMCEERANELLKHIPGWKLLNEDGQTKLHRSWKAKSFVKGFEFLKLVADVAEAEGHHPDFHLVNWNNVNIDIWTHAIRGLTENDFILAAKINAIDADSLLRKGAKSSSL